MSDPTNTPPDGPNSSPPEQAPEPAHQERQARREGWPKGFAHPRAFSLLGIRVPAGWPESEEEFVELLKTPPPVWRLNIATTSRTKIEKVSSKLPHWDQRAAGYPRRQAAQFWKGMVWALDEVIAAGWLTSETFQRHWGKDAPIDMEAAQARSLKEALLRRAREAEEDARLNEEAEAEQKAIREAEDEARREADRRERARWAEEQRLAEEQRAARLREARRRGRVQTRKRKAAAARVAAKNEREGRKPSAGEPGMWRRDDASVVWETNLIDFAYVLIELAGGLNQLSAREICRRAEALVP